eukprot:1642973-Prymnesium_polylepis.1
MSWRSQWETSSSTSSKTSAGGSGSRATFADTACRSLYAVTVRYSPCVSSLKSVNSRYASKFSVD